MEKTRILLPDKNGFYHKLFSVGVRSIKKSLDVYILFPDNFKTWIGSRQTSYEKLLKADSSSQSVSFHEMHLRYPPDGRCHLQFKNSNGESIKDLKMEQQYEELSNLTLARRILTIIPKATKHYPVYRPEPKDSVIEKSLIEGFFVEKPIFLNFWIGQGQGEGEGKDLDYKAGVIADFEQKETLRYVQVFILQNSRMNLFLTVSRPKQLKTFPTKMRLLLHSARSAVLEQ